MQTTVTTIPGGSAEAAAIIKTCVHYGFCTNTCPTYVLLGDENESPRGRIDLIREMLGSDAAPKTETVRHLDNCLSCLSCLSCMTTCAAKVDYAHLIDHARTHIEKTYRRPLFDRLIRTAFARILPNPGMLTAALWAASLARPLTPLFTGRLRAMLELAPGGDRVPAAPRRRRVFPAEGNAVSRVVLHQGCVQQVVAQHINDAAIRLLTRPGVEVVTLGGGACCRRPDPPHGQGGGRPGGGAGGGLGDPDRDGKRFRRCRRHHRVRVRHHHQGLRPSAGRRCRMVGRRRHGRRAGARRVRTARPAAAKGVGRQHGLRVACHDACSMLHGRKITAQPHALLKRAGFQVGDIAERHFCCGSAGTYNMLQPDLAARLGRRKAANVEGTGADILCAGNLGCLTQISRYVDLPAVHLVELLDWAMGGPRPKALHGRDIEPQPAAAAPSRNEAAIPLNESFW